ncbi:AEC family transporter [Sinanaerobacter chloroacetimidivorans]|uniref:AEC family transporter n=1 Tax=Sinanaerobacter chloroacetimidivorans TaxID=2818044 RepID=UPI00386C3DB3
MILDNFIYSLNATVPVFVVMLAGWILRRRGMLNENFVNVADRFNFKVTLPILLFRDIAAMDIMADFELRFFLFCMIATALCFAGIWLFAELLIKDKSLIGSFVQGSFRGSLAVLGIAFIQNIYGNAGLAPLMIVAAVPLYNIFSVVILTLKGENQRGKETERIRSAFFHICTNPIILGIFIGLPFSIFQIDLPTIAEKSLNNFAAMATPLALIAIGAGFELKKALGKIQITAIASFVKLILQPGIFLPIAILMGFRDQSVIALLIMLGAPSTPTCYIMAKNMCNDSVLASGIVVLSMLLSPITITAWIFGLKTFGFI